MCLFAKKKSRADSDIICYKVGIPMENGITSPYMGFPFLFNKEYTDEAPEGLQELEGKKFCVSSGFFHSFGDKKRAEKEANDLIRGYGGSIIFKVYRAIIPKGTEYYEGILYDMCSKKIKILND